MDSVSHEVEHLRFSAVTLSLIARMTPIWFGCRAVWPNLLIRAGLETEKTKYCCIAQLWVIQMLV